MAPANDVADQKSMSRCIDSVRYAVALAVTVIIVTVIVHAITVVLRPEELTITVAGGSVSVEPVGPKLLFSFNLQADNPSGRVRIYYTNITGALTGRNSTTSPPLAFLGFRVNDMSVGQESARVSYVQVTATSGTHGSMGGPKYEPFFDMFYQSGSSMADAVMKLNGTLTIETHSGHNTTGNQALYYCPNLIVGGDSSDQQQASDVKCTTSTPAS